MKLPLALLAHIRIGYPFRTRLEPDPGGNVSVVQVKDLSGGVLRLPELDSLTTVHLQNCNPDHLLHDGDVLVRSRGLSCDATLVLKAARPLVAAAPILVVSPLKELREAQAEAVRQHPDWNRFPVPALNPAYAHWFLNDPGTQALLATLRDGTSTPKLDKAKLAQLPVTLAVGPVQDLIVEAAALATKELTLQQQLLEATTTLGRRELMRYATHNDPLAFFQKAAAFEAQCLKDDEEEKAWQHDLASGEDLPEQDYPDLPDRLDLPDLEDAPSRKVKW